MTKLYKLTDENGKTRAGEANELQWGVSVTHTAQGEGIRLCTDDVIHAYEHPWIAVLLNPMHSKFQSPRLWEAEGEIVVRDADELKVPTTGQLKCGVKTLTTVREIPVPAITLEQRVKFAILCALEVYQEEGFVRWAKQWLKGEDRVGTLARERARALAVLLSDVIAKEREEGICIFDERWGKIRLIKTAEWTARAAASFSEVSEHTKIAEHAVAFSLGVATAAKLNLTEAIEAKFGPHTPS